MNVRLSRDIYDRLLELAEELGQSVSDLTRTAVERYVRGRDQAR